MKFDSEQIIYNIYFNNSELEYILYGLNDRRDYFVSLNDETLNLTILSLETLIEKIKSICSSVADEDETLVSLERRELIIISHGIYNLYETYEKLNDIGIVNRIWDFYKEIEEVLAGKYPNI